MKWKRKYWFILFGIIILVLFFYPKDCGDWGTSLVAKTHSCDCLGYKFNEPLIGGGKTFCSGICLSNTCKCVQYSKEPPYQLIEVPCS